MIPTPGGSPIRRCSFDLGRTMMRMSLRNYLAVVPTVPSDSESCFLQSTTIDRYVFTPTSLSCWCWCSGENAFRFVSKSRIIGRVVSVNGQFPVNEGLLGQFDCVRSLPMMLCCDERTHAADSTMAREIDTTLRLFHAAGGLLSLRVYRNKSKTRFPQVQLADIVGDIDGGLWMKFAVCQMIK